MTIQIVVLFFLIGTTSGIISRYSHISCAILSLMGGFFFLPLLGLGQQSMYPYLLASVLVACLPANLYLWVNELRQGYAQTALFRYAPGVAMGAVIGAQLISILPIRALLVAFTILLTLLIIFTAVELILKVANKQATAFHGFALLQQAKPLPIGLIMGLGSVLVADDRLGLSKVYFKTADQKEINHQSGFGVFICFASLVGFAFPALPPQMDSLNMHSNGFAGMIYLPITLSLAAGLLLSACLPNWRISEFEKNFTALCVNLYLLICLIRIWF